MAAADFDFARLEVVHVVDDVAFVENRLSRGIGLKREISDQCSNEEPVTSREEISVANFRRLTECEE